MRAWSFVSVSRSCSALRSDVSADADYAGRSVKGQLTQAGRVNASATVVVGPAGATIRRRDGQDDEVGLDDLVARLTPR